MAVAILPGLGFPLSPLLILFGIVLGPQFGMPLTCLIGIVTLSFCTTWTYALSSGPLRHLVKIHLLKNFKLPELKGKNGFHIALIIRMTPGIPYPLQNFSLGVMGLDFKSYLLASIPIQSLYAIAFIVTGGAIFEGKFGLAITAALLLVVLILAARVFSNRKKNNA